MKRMMMLLTLAALLLLATTALAMSSPNYRLDWFTLMTGGGGGPANSANYAVNFTVGQTAIGGSTSINYHAGLGYWYGAVAQYRIFLPVVLKRG